MKRVFDGYSSKESNNNCVVISIGFNKGGVNWFSGNEEEKGYWGYFSVGERTEFGSVRTRPTDSINFKVKLLSLSRRNKKKEEKLFELISSKEISDLVWEGKKKEVYFKIIKLINDGINI